MLTNRWALEQQCDIYAASHVGDAALLSMSENPSRLHATTSYRSTGVARSFSAELTGKPTLAAGSRTFVYETPLAALPEASAPNLRNKSFTITAEAEIPAGGSDCMIFTQGGFTGGWGFCIQQGRLVGLHNYFALDRYRVVSTEPVSTCKATLVMDFKYDGGGMAKGGTLTLLANGRKMPHRIPGTHAVRAWKC
jgi:hypothetical protein